MTLLQNLLTEYANNQYTPSDVFDKISSANKKATDSGVSDSKCYGLQDSSGNIVKVYVSPDQAEEFEHELARRLGTLTDGDNAEIAEVLFDMHNKFNIINVEWPTIQQDEEQLPPEQDGQPSPEGMDAEGMDAEVPEELSPEEGDISGDLSGAAETDPVAATALQSVIQAMAADAEARRQESLAKAAEARAREAEAAARIADGKLKAEEEIADMEAFYGDQQVEKQEAKKLAKLARYRHQLKQRETNTGEFNDFAGAEDALQNDSDSRVDTAPGSVAGSLETEFSEPASAPVDGPESAPADGVEDALKKTGLEDEEQSVDINVQYAKVDKMLNYLLQMQAANDR